MGLPSSPLKSSEFERGLEVELNIAIFRFLDVLASLNFKLSVIDVFSNFQVKMTLFSGASTTLGWLSIYSS